MKSKTVAIVINTSWNIFNFRLGLIGVLQEKGYRVIAISPTDKYVKKLKSAGIEHYNININNKGTNPLEDAKLIYGFYKRYKELAPNILLHYTIKPNIYGSMAASLLGIPAISNISGLGTVFLNNSFSSKMARILYKVALKVPKKVFYQNSQDRELFINMNLVDEKKTGLLPGSGIDTQIFKPLDYTKQEKNKVFQFLFIARLVKDKGIVEYVDAAREVSKSYPTVEFSILGSYYEGNPTAITEDEMKVWEKEGVITYLGASDDVKSFISTADSIVLPSYREGLSRVLLEAASMAKPIIASNVPGCKDVIDDGINGYLCEAKDVSSLVEQMEKMILLSSNERREMGKRGREKVIREFEEHKVIDKYVDAIHEILK